MVIVARIAEKQRPRRPAEESLTYDARASSAVISSSGMACPSSQAATKRSSPNAARTAALTTSYSARSAGRILACMLARRASAAPMSCAACVISPVAHATAASPSKHSATWTSWFPGLPVVFTEDDWSTQPNGETHCGNVNGCEGTYLVDLFTWLNDHNCVGTQCDNTSSPTSHVAFPYWPTHSETIDASS